MSSPVWVKWVDSTNLFGDRWASRDDLKEHQEETYCETLGWVVDENDHSVYVAGSVAPEEIGSVMQIPRVSIKEIRTVQQTALSEAFLGTGWADA